MKIEKEVYNVQKSGDFEELDMKISKKGQEMLIEALSTTLYSNPIGSIVREIASNSLDAHKEIKNTDSIEIEYVSKNRLTGQFEPSVIFRDFGPGMSPQRFRDTYSNIGESTKSGDNEQIGGFGIGKMTAFAYTDSFTVRTIHDKIDYTYVISRTEDSKIKIFKMHQQPSTLDNRTEIIIGLKNEGDRYTFENAISNQLTYFKNIKYIGWSSAVKAPVIDYEDDDLVISVNTPYHHNMHVLLGGVVYPIDWSLLSDSKNLDFKVDSTAKVALKFNIGDLRTSLNRETIYYTEQTKNALRDKIKSVSTRIFNEITANLKIEKNLIEVCRKLQNLSQHGHKISVSLKDQLLQIKGQFCAFNSNSATSYDFENIKLTNQYNCFRFFNIRSVTFDYQERIQYNKSNPYDFSRYGNVYYAENTLSTKKSKCIWIKGEGDKKTGINPKQTFLIIEPLPIDPTVFKSRKEEDEFKKQQDDMIAILKRDCLDYDNYIVDESVFNANDMAKFYTAAELREQNNSIFAKAVWSYNKSNGVKTIEFTAYEPKVKDIPKHPAKTIIYGFADDDTKLRHAAYILLNNTVLKDNFPTNRFKSGTSGYAKAEVLILKINKQNERHFKNRHKGVIHINDWLMKSTDELVKFYTGFKIDNVLDRYSYLNYFDKFNLTIYKKYTALKAYRDKYLSYNVDKTTLFVKDVLLYCEDNGVWDQGMLRILAQVEQYCSDLNILKYVKSNKDFGELEGEDVDVIVDILKVKNKSVTFTSKPLTMQQEAELKGRSAVRAEYVALCGGKYVKIGYYTNNTPFYMYSKNDYSQSIANWIESLPLLKLDLTKKIKLNLVKSVNNKQVIKTKPVVQEIGIKVE